jgi:hypothetical protein
VVERGAGSLDGVVFGARPTFPCCTVYALLWNSTYLGTKDLRYTTEPEKEQRSPRLYSALGACTCGDLFMVPGPDTRRSRSSG